MTMGILLDNVSKKGLHRNGASRFCFCMPFAYLFAFFLAALAGAVTRQLDFLPLER